MSEGFDKEAERERLREKFANEEAEREAAIHMSELLLQGATMTDRHCPECGTPLFREDDRTFCPECERTVVESDAEEVYANEESSGEADDQQTTSLIDSGGTEGSGPYADVRSVLLRSTAAAAATDDPRLAREHLETARAAIETLAALNDAYSGS